MKIQNYIVVKINVTLTFSCYVKPRRSSCMYLLLHFSQGFEGGGGGGDEITLFKYCFFFFFFFWGGGGGGGGSMN